MKCLNCGKKIIAKEGQRPFDAKRKKFCDKSCSATYNNKKFPKRKPNKDKICECGERKGKNSLTCHKCKVKRSVKNACSRKISEMFCKGNARVKYAQIRKWAARLMKEVYCVEKKCEICGFDIVVEVCHIKPISEFDDDVLMEEVNSRDNLKYLCPNHHAMFDRGLL